MLRSLEELFDYTVAARDGNLGRAKDFLFDDQCWRVRYLLVEIGGWMSGRRVLLRPEFLESPRFVGHAFPVDLTCDRVEQSPPLNTDKPVYLQRGLPLPRVFDWGLLLNRAEAEPGDPHLRSAREVISYAVRAEDGAAGQVKDLTVDDELWTLNHLVVETGGWFQSRQVLLETNSVRAVRWSTREIEVNPRRGEIELRPEYDPGHPINRRKVERFHDTVDKPPGFGGELPV